MTSQPSLQDQYAAMLQEQGPQQGGRSGAPPPGAGAGAQQSNSVLIEGFFRGAGATKYRPGFYEIGTNFDGRYGGPGPREVVDLTGIAAGFRVIKMVRHANVPMLATTDGTDTKIYRLETTWALKATITSRVATDMVTFNSVLAVAFGSSFAYQFSTNTAGGAYTFTASTKTAANSKFANYFLVQSIGLLLPRVTYITDPNELYYTGDLTNTTDTTGSTATYIDDNNSALNYTTSLTQSDTGKMLIGMRHALYTVDTTGIVEKLTRDYPSSLNDAGGQSDRKNFENPVVLGNRIYYPVEGYRLLEYFHGHVNENMAPRSMNPGIPRMDLPINAVASVGGWLVLALGSKNTATIKSVTYMPGGASHLANTFTAASELWIGQYQQTDQGETFVWHGVLLLCTSALRYMWFDEDSSYLYLASGDSEAVNVQQRRCLFYVDNPLTRLTSGNIILNAGTWSVDVGALDFGAPFDYKRAVHASFDTVGLLGVEGTNPSVAVQYKLTPDSDTSAFLTNIPVFYDNGMAEIGHDFRSGEYFRKLHLRFVGIGTGNTYSVLRSAQVDTRRAPEVGRPRAVR